MIASKTAINQQVNALEIQKETANLATEMIYATTEKAVMETTGECGYNFSFSLSLSTCKYISF